MKTSRQLERYFKGAANHTRLDILLLVEENQGMTLEDISDTLGGNFMTISSHTQRLVQAGLLNKAYRGRAVMHTLSPYGKRFTVFMKKF